jgi:hypothetical protein
MYGNVVIIAKYIRAHPLSTKLMRQIKWTPEYKDNYFTLSKWWQFQTLITCQPKDENNNNYFPETNYFNSNVEGNLVGNLTYFVIVAMPL